MTQSVRYAFASREWLAALHGYLIGKTDKFTKALDGRDFALCEVYTDVPPSVNRSDRVVVSWAYVAGALRFEDREWDDVQLKLVADWATIAPLASRVVSGDRHEDGNVDEAIALAVQTGKLVFERRDERPAILSTVHDDMARMTRVIRN